jgi:hypothetical protein
MADLLGNVQSHQGVAILCWCSPLDYCHRRLAAEWLEAHCEIVVPEFGFPRDQTETYFDWS